MVDKIVEQATETTNRPLFAEGLNRETWLAIAGILRLCLRMPDMGTTGASKLATTTTAPRRSGSSSG